MYLNCCDTMEYIDVCYKSRPICIYVVWMNLVRAVTTATKKLKLYNSGGKYIKTSIDY